MIEDTVLCDHSYWIYSKKGGIIDVFPELASKVKKGDIIANVYDVFGQVKEEIIADRSGIVIGKNIMPNCSSGTRVLHLGVNLFEASPNQIPGE